MKNPDISKRLNSQREKHHKERMKKRARHGPERKPVSRLNPFNDIRAEIRKEEKECERVKAERQSFSSSP